MPVDHRIVRLGLCLLLAGQIQAGLPNADEKEREPVPSRWQDIEEAMGAVSLDGTLRLAYAINTPRALRDLGIILQLRHQLKVDAFGQARSMWQFVGLRCRLVPAGRDRLVWHRLDGGALHFEREKISRVLSNAGGGDWRIRESSPDHYELRSADGKAWSFASGQPFAAEHPRIGLVRIEAKGGWISSVQGQSSGEARLLEVVYDESIARPVRIEIGGAPSHRFEWNADGQLVRWMRERGSDIAFGYNDGLLGAVTDETGSRNVRWRSNPGWRRGDSRWSAPVHLAAYGDSVFSFELARRGFVLRHNRGSSLEPVITVFNPRIGRLKQTNGAQDYTVTFRLPRPGQPARLKQIVNGRNDMLERYTYDEHGRLIGVERAGEGAQRLQYDELGRLIAVDASDASANPGRKGDNPPEVDHE